MTRLFFALSLAFMALPLAAGEAKVTGVRVWSAPDNTRLVFELSEPVEHSIFGLSNPDRLIVDLKNVGLAGKVDSPGPTEQRLLKLRHGQQSQKDLRVVLDLKQAVRAKSFLLKPSAPYGHRLVIELHDREDASAPPAAAKATAASTPTKPATTESAAKTGKAVPAGRDIVIAIDAGHGGEDPGALGASGSREKDMTLAIARRLEKLIRAEPGMRPVLTRSGDYYVGLRKRTQLARKQRADLFVSIHADAFKDQRARGTSVFVLSDRGASSEAARWLAESENAADLVGGVSLDDKDEVLASVLLDLSQTGTRRASLDGAQSVFDQLGKLGEVHVNEVQQAGFAVLKSPDIPSMLVETAFISNPEEERRLRNPAHQQLIAEAILRGIRGYFHKSPPPGTLLAAQQDRKHVIAAGESLAAVAQRYAVSVGSLRDVNGLDTDRVRVGQILRIPES
jgi:N-acetylmuramoyl-L-alanine amidase